MLTLNTDTSSPKHRPWMPPVKLFLDKVMMPCRLPEMGETANESLPNHKPLGLRDPQVDTHMDSAVAEIWGLFYVCKPCRRVWLASCWNMGNFSLENRKDRGERALHISQNRGGNLRWQKHNGHKQWECIFQWRTSTQNKSWGYRWLKTEVSMRTNRHLVGAGNACHRSPYRARSKVNAGSILTSNRSRNKHFFYILMGSQMKEMSKKGEKEKTNKQELDLYEILIVRNAHSISASLSSGRCMFPE